MHDAVFNSPGERRETFSTHDNSMLSQILLQEGQPFWPS
jgi:hypothetical protein